jgi:2-isopropylmalate synthase
VEVTINGIGERAGNTSLEEVVMALHTRAPVLQSAHQHQHTQIMKSQPHGQQLHRHACPAEQSHRWRNAFSHEAGIHQDGVLKHHSTYEIMTPETSACRRATWCWASTAAGMRCGTRLQGAGLRTWKTATN